MGHGFHGYVSHNQMVRTPFTVSVAMDCPQDFETGDLDSFATFHTWGSPEFVVTQMGEFDHA